MSATLGQVKSRVRALLDDPAGSWTTDDFIVPLINQVYEDACSQIEATLSGWDIADVEIQAVQPGTPNLTQLQAGDGPLSGLTDKPERIDWKVAGNDPSYYSLVPGYAVLPDLQPQQWMAGWEWRSEVIWLTQCSIVVDLRIRGEFAPTVLVEDTSVLTAHPRIGYVVAYGTAALIGTVRGNEAWVEKYGLKAEEGLDEIMSQLTRQSQSETRRVGRTVGRDGSSRGWGNTIG